MNKLAAADWAQFRLDRSIPLFEKALERQVALYTALDKPAEVAKWQAEIERRKTADQSDIMPELPKNDPPAKDTLSVGS